jgi:cytochrome oxidase Cu insertion factor (SCO1/SenC/PrrC family)/cytochrome c2
MPRAYRIWAALAAALLALTAPARAVERDASYFTNLPLVTQTGETVRFYDDLIRDKIVVFNFIYTECPDLCSLSTARLAHIADWLGDRVGRDIFIYSISLDPVTDTPEKLRVFADSFGAKPGWIFLTGEPENVKQIQYKLGERNRVLQDHRSQVVIGNARTNVWRRASLMGNLRLMSQSILELDPDWRPAQRTASAGGLDGGMIPVNGTRGESFFIKACATCHTIGEGDKFGPDLLGVTMRRNRDWLFRYLRAPDRMIDAGDPVAVALDAAYPGVKMPFLDLGETDIADLLAYLEMQFEARTTALGTAEMPEGAHLHGGEVHDHSRDPIKAPAQAADHDRVRP